MLFQSSKLLLLCDKTNSYLLHMDNLSFFGRNYNDFFIWEVFLFWGLDANFNTILFFSQLFRGVPPDNMSLYQGTSFLWSDCLRHAVCDVNSREYVFQTVCHHKRELVPLEFFSQTSTFTLIAIFLNVNSPFLKRRKMTDSSSHDWSFLFWTLYTW